MENASKALMMAAGVLMSLLVIGALILMFNNLTSYQEVNTRDVRSSQITEFNSQYLTYDRDDVRGSELYSLLNKVIDYNRRESTEGTGWADTGDDINYQAMEITFSLNGIEDDLIADNSKGKLLITNSSYTINKNQNTFENSIKSEVDRLERKYGSNSLTGLTTNLTAIFISDSSTDREKAQAIDKFNSSSKKISISSFDEINEDSTIREEVYKYYEYVQFKRAHFDCTNVSYNTNTGRVISMTFVATGEFN